MRNANTRLRSRSTLFGIMLIFLLLSIGLPTVTAQGSVPIPLAVGENQTGELTELAPVVTYAVGISEPQTVDVAVFAITPGFAPTFRVIDPLGVTLDAASTLGTATAVQASPVFGGPGVYMIEVSSANGSFGQYLITLQPGEPVQPPQPLALGQPESNTLTSQAGRQAYSFAAAENDVLIISVDSEAESGGPVVIIRDADTGETLGISSARLGGARFRIPRGVENYLVEVSNGDATAPLPYRVCVGSETGTPACPQVAAQQVGVIPTLTLPVIQLPATQPPTALPTSTPVPPPTLVPLPATGPCIVASATGGAVNVRSGPSTNYSILGQIFGPQTAQVIGRLPDSSWYQIAVNSLIGWISASVVRTGGVCLGVPMVQPPTAVPSITSAPTATSTTSATATPTVTATDTPTATPTQPEIVATLNFSLPPVYGSTALTSGFVPDPFSVGVTGGGPANVNYLGGGCSGYTTSAPSFSVNYTAGAFPTLRFYFLGSGDTTMIINTPGGSYVCVDDSFGTLNPTIDFNAPSSGRYDVWIGTFNAGGSVGGTLYVTESTANHP